MFQVTQQLLAQLHAFLALLLLISSAHKWLRRARARDAVHALVGVPRHLTGWAVGTISLLELCAAVLLVIPTARITGALLAALIWGVYWWLMVRAIVEGRRDVDCGCSFGKSHRPLGVFQLARNLVLVSLAGAIALVPAGDASGALPAGQMLAAFAMLALYSALDQAMAVQPTRRAGDMI